MSQSEQNRSIMKDVLNWFITSFLLFMKKNVIIEFLKPGFHLSGKSQTIGDFTAKRQKIWGGQQNVKSAITCDIWKLLNDTNSLVAPITPDIP